jgi:hypothetical protein
MLRTVKEWLSDLPEPYRDLALHNCLSDRGDAEVLCMSHAINYAFGWDRSPQSRCFWEDLHRSYSHIEGNISKRPDLMTPGELERELRIRYRPGDLFQERFILKEIQYDNARIENYDDIRVEVKVTATAIGSNRPPQQGEITLYSKGEWKTVTRGYHKERSLKSAQKTISELAEEMTIERKAKAERRAEYIAEATKEQPKPSLVVIEDQIIYLP